MYIQFDNQTNYYGTFKVETVGDAYIVISGVPEPADDHADRIVEMGLAMVHVTRTIYSPSDGKHIEVKEEEFFEKMINYLLFSLSLPDANRHPLWPLYGRRRRPVDASLRRLWQHHLTRQ